MIENVVVPFYWTEALTDTVEELLRTEAETGLSQLVEVELFSAVSRRVRMGRTPSSNSRAIAEQFQAHLDSFIDINYSWLLIPSSFQRFA